VRCRWLGAVVLRGIGTCVRYAGGGAGRRKLVRKVRVSVAENNTSEQNQNRACADIAPDGYNYWSILKIGLRS